MGATDKLVELQQAQVRVLREALMECRRVLIIDNEYPPDSISVQQIDAALAQTQPKTAEPLDCPPAA